MSRLAKNSHDKMIFGVCGGLAKSTGIDSSLIRLGFVIGAVFTGSLLFWIYLGLGILLPYDGND
jgi:phage shock protein C